MTDKPIKIIKFAKLSFVPATHEDKDNPGSLKKVLFHAFDIPKDVKIQMFNWSRILKGKSFNAHYHEDMDEIFVILNGRVRLTVKDKEFTMETGDSVYIPQKYIHQMFNQFDHDVDYIALGLSRGLGGKSVNV
jgi:mannose-6-phosphate isomerase-like protein (cupin superfamily)